MDKDNRDPGQNQGYPAPIFDFHSFSIGLAKHLTLFLYNSPFILPIIRFIVELKVFPSKVQDLIHRLTLDNPVPNPQSPLGRALHALNDLKRLVEEARGHMTEQEAQEVKEKIEQADDLANNDEIFPGEGLPGEPASPVNSEDLESIRAELQFMRQYIALYFE